MTKRTIAGREHQLILLKITNRDEKNRPSEAIIGHDDTTFNIQGGEEFVTAWVPTETMKPRVAN
jgi:hypothetical protein